MRMRSCLYRSPRQSGGSAGYLSEIKSWAQRSWSASDDEMESSGNGALANFPSLTAARRRAVSASCAVQSHTNCFSYSRPPATYFRPESIASAFSGRLVVPLQPVQNIAAADPCLGEVGFKRQRIIVGD